MLHRLLRAWHPGDQEGAMLKLLFLSVAALAQVQQPPAPDPAQAPSAINAAVPQILAQTGVPSVSVARIEGGRIVWAGAWGERSAGASADIHTLYNVASLAKPISAETMLRAASAGKIDLDEPMARAWVDPDLTGDPRHAQLTARHSLTHRSGFPNWRTGRLAFEADPGARIRYSGEGFEYAARYTERRAGETFEALAERLVFAPAGMRATSYTRRDWFGARVAQPRMPDGRWVTPTIRTNFVASDDVHTTASDYARFLLSAARRQGLTPALAAERERIQSSTRETQCKAGREAVCPDQSGFGLGWDVMRFGDRATIWHTGKDEGTFTFAYVTPETGEGLVILTNGDEGYKVVLPIMEAVGADPRILAYLRTHVE
jgi:CubicO group peptidase (beta-lactamase class C family)